MTHAPDLARRRLLLAGLAFGLITPAQARNYGLAAGGGRSDEAQVGALLSTGALALQTSLVAVNRSPNPDIRAFARSEIDEQRSVSAAITGSTRPAVPLGRRGFAVLAEARSLPGGITFDRAYVARQIEGHRQLLALAETYAATGNDPQVVGVAQGSLPLIRLHLATLGRLDRSLNG